MALSPEPIPSMARPPESSSMLAMALAVTTRCRVRGLVTSGPTRTRVVLSAARVSVTYISRNTDCESATPSRSKPCSSTSRHRAGKPSSESGSRTIPNRAPEVTTDSARGLVVERVEPRADGAGVQLDERVDVGGDSKGVPAAVLGHGRVDVHERGGDGARFHLVDLRAPLGPALALFGRQALEHGHHPLVQLAVAVAHGEVRRGPLPGQVVVDSAIRTVDTRGL